MQVIGLALMEATALGLGMDLEGEEWLELKSLVNKSFWVMRYVARLRWGSLHSNQL
jgi:hypothetical protein